MTDPTKRIKTCNVCNKAFKTFSALVVHSVVHTGEQPFECDDCCTKFNTKSALTRHQLIHEDLRPFECLICGKTDRNKYRLKIHIQDQHNLTGDRLEAAIQSSGRRRNIRKSARSVLSDTDTVSTPNTVRKAPKRSRQEDEEDLEDDSDSDNSSGTPPEQQREIDSDSVVTSNQGTGNNGNIDEVNDQIESNEDGTEEKPEKKPSLILAPLPKRRKISTPLIKMTPFPIKIEENVPIVQDAVIEPVATAPVVSTPVTPQFSFEEDIRQIAHQLTRVATARPECHDALREVLYGTIVAFGSGKFDKNVGEFFKTMNNRYNH